MSIITDLQNSIVAGACGANEALGAMDDALGGMEDAINGALDDINGAIGDLQAKVDEAQAALENAIGDALAEVETLQGKVANILKDALDPLKLASGDIEKAISDLREKYIDAVDDIDALIDTVTKMIEDPLGAAAALCDLPNIEDGPDGTPIQKAREALVPAMDAVQPTIERIGSSFRTITEQRIADLGPIRSLSSGIEIPTTGLGGGTITGGAASSLQAAMLQRESSGDYSVINKYGYVGGYQFGASALETLGYIERGASARGNSVLNDPSVWTGKGGASSLSAFLSNRSLQDTAFQENVEFNYGVLRRIGRIDDNTPSSEVAGYLAASHLLGAGGTADLNSTDANGTKGQEYFDIGVAAASAPVAAEFPDARPASVGSGSVTVADLTTQCAIPYSPSQGSNIYGLSLDQINTNLEVLASDIMSPIKDAYPDIIISHGFRDEYYETGKGPRTNPGRSHHYGGWACDFKFADITTREQAVERGNAIRRILPQFTQFIIEYPGSFDNRSMLFHISYVPHDPRNEVLTAVARNSYRDGFV